MGEQNVAEIRAGRRSGTTIPSSSLDPLKRHSAEYHAAGRLPFGLASHGHPLQHKRCQGEAWIKHIVFNELD
jgi:hypothetical protein